MTGNDHQNSFAVEQVAQWLSEQRQAPNTIPARELRQRFNLSTTEVSEAVSMAERFKTYRQAFG